MSIFRLLFCVASLALCVLTLLQLAAVLSYPDFEQAAAPIAKTRCDQGWDLLFDILLLVSLLFLHYLFNCLDFFACYSASLQRCIYSAVTAFVFQIGLFYWRRTSAFSLWSLTGLSSLACLLILSLHAMCYLQLIANSVFDEAVDAFGFRSLSSSSSELSRFETPSAYFNKSQELARLEGRLPSSGGLTSLLVLFLVYPTMSLDRALAALVVVTYNFCTSTLDQQDFFYVRRYLLKKRDELLYDSNKSAGMNTMASGTCLTLQPSSTTHASSPYGCASIIKNKCLEQNGKTRCNSIGLQSCLASGYERFEKGARYAHSGYNVCRDQFRQQQHQLDLTPQCSSGTGHIADLVAEDAFVSLPSATFRLSENDLMSTRILNASLKTQHIISGSGDHRDTLTATDAITRNNRRLLNVPVSRSSSQDSFHYEARSAVLRNRGTSNVEVRELQREEVTASSRRSTRASSRKL